MTETQKFYRKLWALSFVLLLAGSLWAQAPSDSAGKPNTHPSAGEDAGVTKQVPGGTKQGAVGAKISPKEAEELFRSIDEILKFASSDTALPIKKDIKRKLTSRDEVVAYLEKNMSEDKDAQRLRRS